jgi:N-acetylglucosaminylphosphatidylinositol deacetylase
LTFDNKGISGHPNHIGLHEGAAEFVRRSAKHDVTVFSLTTVPVTDKYIGYLAPLYYQVLARMLGAPHIANSANRFISSFWGYATAFRAMQDHWSQLVWFRWLYILTSRYMWMNEWTVIPPEAGVS